jgi:hypothetical protein
MSSRPAWAIYQHPVSKTTTTKKWSMIGHKQFKDNKLGVRVSPSKVGWLRFTGLGIGQNSFGMRFLEPTFWQSWSEKSFATMLQRERYGKGQRDFFFYINGFVSYQGHLTPVQGM